MEESYFFDSYAIMEISKGNNNYEDYINTNILITNQNLFEIYFSTLWQINEDAANELFEDYKIHTVNIVDEDIKEAAKLKFKYKDRKLSMVDSIGYAVAKRFNVKFLTGDKEFKDLDNVEFVK
jgi:predicted nucleic acid-binding protein